MAALIILTCDCREQCLSAFTSTTADATAARIDAASSGWDRDTVGGTTYDVAPGHVITWEHA